MNMSIQNIQMGKDVNGGEADFQRLDFEAGSACYYAWMPAADCEPNGVECPEGLNGVWVKEITESQWNEKKQKYVDVVVGYELPAGEEGTILAGEGVQIEALDQAAAIVMCPYDL